MPELPIEIERKIEQLPILPPELNEELQTLLYSDTFSDIFSFYKKNYLPDLLKSKADIYQRISLYLVLTDQAEELTEKLDEVLLRRPIPTIEEFLSGRFFSYNANATLYPYWKDVLRNIFRENSPVLKAIFGGSIGIGKSTVARKAFLYVLYRLFCYRNLRSVLNIDQDSTIANVCISITLKQVYETNTLAFIKLMETMPCFQRVMSQRSFENFNLDDPRCPIPYVTEKSSGNIYFPDNIIFTCGSNAGHFTGYNVVNSFCFTEAMKVYTNLGILTFFSLLTHFNRGEKIYTYSINEKGEKEKTLITDVKITGYKTELIRIYYTDDRYIECTPEHPFIISNAKKDDINIVWENGLPYKQAQFLTEEDEILSENNAFVYELIDNRPASKNYNKPFYIGISSHDNTLGKAHSTIFSRPYSHFTRKSLKTDPNNIKKSIIRKILDLGLKPKVNIIKQNITLEEAYNLEKQLILKYGKLADNSGILANISAGGEGIILTTPEMIKQKSENIKKTKRLQKEERLKKQNKEWQVFLNSKYGLYSLLIVCLQHLYQVHLNRSRGASLPHRREFSSKHLTQYNKSEEHKKLTAYYNSIRPKVSSTESKQKLSKSQKATWAKKTKEEKQIANYNKYIGKAWSIIKRIDGNIINETIYMNHRSKISNQAKSEPIWDSIILKVGGVEKLLNEIEIKYGKRFVYEN